MRREEDTGYERALLVALRSIRRSDRLRAEVEKNLRCRGFDPDTVEAVLARLGSWGFLDDSRTVDERVSQMRHRRVGRARIVADLMERGAPESTVEAALGKVSEQDEVEAASALLERRPKATPAQAGRYLAGRGFDEEVVREVLLRHFPNEGVA